MCGRYLLNATLEAILAILKIKAELNLAPRFNIAPGQPILAARLDAKGERELAHVRWGLIPSWMKEMPTNVTMINARMETVAEKPSFKGAYKYRRCLIPATGFYEWQVVNGPKQPYCIYLPDQPVFAFAGLWEHWQGPDGSEIETAAILTGEASLAIRDIHERMPVILRPGDHEAWLAGEKGAEDVFDPDMKFGFHPVSRRVNAVANDDASLIEEEAVQEQRRLL